MSILPNKLGVMNTLKAEAQSVIILVEGRIVSIPLKLTSKVFVIAPQCLLARTIEETRYELDLAFGG